MRSDLRGSVAGKERWKDAGTRLDMRNTGRTSAMTRKAWLESLEAGPWFNMTLMYTTPSAMTVWDMG